MGEMYYCGRRVVCRGCVRKPQNPAASSSSTTGGWIGRGALAWQAWVDCLLVQMQIDSDVSPVWTDGNYCCRSVGVVVVVADDDDVGGSIRVSQTMLDRAVYHHSSPCWTGTRITVGAVKLGTPLWLG